ncbi:MAG TPA: cupin domain-containing protein [Segeticoccus sp.]|jgi:uncharacterized RmlC-like cupin family protein|nr:cupin domain-containing protein [Segeticoccus sp.]
MNFEGFELEGDPRPWALPDGRVMPVVTKGGLEDVQTSDSGGAMRVSGVSNAHTPATRLWYGRVSNKPGFRSVTHHHGEAETGGYVLSGSARIYFGEGFQEFVDMEEGDWVFVPPFLPHVECNMSTTEDLIWLTTRTPDNIVVNLEDVEDRVLKGFRRA